MNNIKYHFNKAKFYTTVNELKCLPETVCEIAIVGRSNAGKSSLLNTLTNQNRLAFTSKTPGRTQHINYFEIIDGVHLVDLPGYGYAKVPEAVRKHWVGLLGEYLATRTEIIGLVLIMDARRPMQDLDIQMLEFFMNTGNPIHIVLSKSDKLNNQEKSLALRTTQAELVKRGFENYSLQLFSSLKKSGLDNLEQTLNHWLNENLIVEEIETDL